MRTIRAAARPVLLAITLVAIAGIYLYVAPQLESRLRDEKLDTLSRDAQPYSKDLVRAIGTNVDVNAVNRAVRLAADRANTRVTLLGVSPGSQGGQTYPIADSAASPRSEELTSRPRWTPPAPAPRPRHRAHDDGPRRRGGEAAVLQPAGRSRRRVLRAAGATWRATSP